MDDKGVKWGRGETYFYYADKSQKYKITKGPDVHENQYVYDIVGVSNPNAKHPRVPWTDITRKIYKTVRVNRREKYSVEINERGEEDWAGKVRVPDETQVDEEVTEVNGKYNKKVG